MRTTIEIPDEQRARLLEIAARRGERGFSGIVQEAIEQYLERQGLRAERVQAALRLRGSFRDAAGARLDERAREARGTWR